MPRGRTDYKTLARIQQELDTHDYDAIAEYINKVRLNLIVSGYGLLVSALGLVVVNVILTMIATYRLLSKMDMWFAQGLIAVAASGFVFAYEFKFLWNDKPALLDNKTGNIIWTNIGSWLMITIIGILDWASSYWTITGMSWYVSTGLAMEVDAATSVLMAILCFVFLSIGPEKGLIEGMKQVRVNRALWQKLVAEAEKNIELARLLGHEPESA